MTLEAELTIAHATCPCVEKPWAVTRCRNCGTAREHAVDLCEWRGHAAIKKVVQATRLQALEQIKLHVDRDPAIAAEVRKILQWAA